MAFDIATHKLVPQHTKLTDAEKEKLLQEGGLMPKQLPKIVKTDPAILSLKPNVGDVIKIERKSATAGVANYYRVVIDG